MPQALRCSALSDLTMLHIKPNASSWDIPAPCSQAAGGQSTPGGSADAAETLATVQLHTCAAHGRGCNDQHQAAGQPAPLRPVELPDPKQMQAVKRPAPSWPAGPPEPKKQRRSSAPVLAAPAPLLWSVVKQPTSRTLAALDYLRDVLYATERGQREAAILRMSPRLRSALLTFMESRRHGLKEASTASSRTTATQPRPRAPRCQDESTCSETVKVRTIQTSEGVKYQASVHVKAMRLYARGQSGIQAALKQQKALLVVRRALLVAAARSPGFWEDSAEVWRVCQDALVRSNVSEAGLGLSAFVHLRASRWLGQRCSITSRAMDIRATVELHAHLLRARRESWEALREAWIDLLALHGRGATRVDRSVAEAMVDEARRASLCECLARAICGAEAALASEARRAAQAVRLRCQESRRIAKDVAKNEMARKLRQKKIREHQHQRLRWLRRNDLTTEEMLRGLPPHLQQRPLHSLPSPPHRLADLRRQS
mmetsp:Transcript_99472/g.264376  ORF Transcript_99472/g.264376 Transcript_99472/m.264376 type:complete len:486 (-) Transcript_99472:62-1519(-)